MIPVAFLLFTVCLAVFFVFAGDVFGQPGAGYTVTVSAKSQAAGGIRTETLESSRRQEMIEAYGTVLQPGEMFMDRTSFVSASSALEKANAELEASKRQYRRLKTLNEIGKNVSDRAVEAAAASLASDTAGQARASWLLQEAEDRIKLEWGDRLAGWIFTSSPGYQRLVNSRDVLVRVTVPPAEALRGIPAEIGIRSPAGPTARAGFMSRARSTDPRIQGVSFIYIAPSLPAGLLPGMNVTARLPAGKAQTGFFIPLSSVVWLNGRAWVYIKKTGTGFDRVEVPVSTSVTGGYFVAGTLNFSNGERIVVGGAQALLSAEMQPKVKKPKGGEEDEDED
ncbi:MAG: hypothetical protein M0Z58_01555 [Nitrospiraceae bacterium]|nr:hypothetical protein [Nitrospiraceae bacterium]